MNANTNATVISTDALKAACRERLEAVCAAGGAPQTTNGITSAVNAALGCAIKMHRVRYALEQLEADGHAQCVREGRAIGWALSDTMAQELRDMVAIQERDREDARRAADSKAAAEAALNSTDAAIDEAVAVQVAEAAEAVAEQALATELAQVIEQAPQPAKRRRSSKAQPTDEDRKAQAKAARQRNDDRKAKRDADKQAKAQATAEAQAADARQQADALVAGGLDDRIVAVLATGRPRDAATLARLTGVSGQRAAFNVVVDDMVAAGTISRLDDGQLCPSAAIGGQALLDGIAAALGSGASASNDSVVLTGDALVKLAGMLKLDIATGTARSRNLSQPAGCWPIIARDGNVVDDATREPIGTWERDGNAYSATLASGATVQAEGRSALRQAIIDTLAEAA